MTFAIKSSDLPVRVLRERVDKYGYFYCEVENNQQTRYTRKMGLENGIKFAVCTECGERIQKIEDCRSVCCTANPVLAQQIFHVKCFSRKHMKISKIEADAGDDLEE